MNEQIAKGSLAGDKVFYGEACGAKPRSASARSRKVDGARATESEGSDLEGHLPFRVETLGSIRPVLRTRWLIKGLMPSQGLHVIYGAPGAGKSFVALNAALHIAGGLRWAGRLVNQCGAIYVASEGSEAMRTRVAAARDRLKLKPDVPFGLITDAPSMGHQADDTKRLRDSIKEQASKLAMRPGVIFLDTLSRSITDLDESKSQDMMVFVKRAQELAKDLQALVVPIHHCGKEEDRGMRGSSALHGATDAEWLVKREGDLREIHIQKMRDGPDGLPLAFRLATVGMGSDQDGDAVETCVMEFAERSLTVSRPSPNEQALLDALRVLCQTEGKADASLSPAGTRIVEEKRLKEVTVGANLLPNLKAASLNSRFPMCLTSLQAAGLIGREAGKLWIAPRSTAA